MLLQIILEMGITLAIKTDELGLCLILNNYIAAHIADYLTISPVGLYLTGLMVSLLHSLPATDQQIDSFKRPPSFVSDISESKCYCFEKT